MSAYKTFLNILNAGGNKRKQFTNTVLMNAGSKDEYIKIINDQLPSCLEVIVYDINENNKNTERFKKLNNKIDLSDCNYFHSFKPFGTISFYLIFNEEICVGGMELEEGLVEFELFARTHKNFYKLSIYKFLVGVFMLYLGLFSNKLFSSNAVHKASSFVLKLFNQKIISQDTNNEYSFKKDTNPKTKMI